MKDIREVLEKKEVTRIEEQRVIRDIGVGDMEFKITNKVVMEVVDSDGKGLIPSYAVRGVQRPDIIVKGNGGYEYGDIVVWVYDIIAPSITMGIYKGIEGDKRYRVRIAIYGSSGEVVEEWVVKGVRVKGVGYSKLDVNDMGVSIVEVRLGIGDVGDVVYRGYGV